MMKFWNFVLNCLIVGIIAFAVGVLVSFLINLILHGTAAVLWGDMFRIAVVVGVMVPLAEYVKLEKKD